MSEKTWLGIDPGLAIIGWAILQEQAQQTPLIMDYGIIETNKQLSTSQRLVEIEQDLGELLQEFQLDGIAIEMPFFSRTIKAAGGVMQALGVINLLCYRETKIEPIFLHQASWKCHLGDGRATKKDVAQMVGRLFNLDQLPIDDSVDAIAIAYAGLCGLTNNI
ncbi:MAG: crossover junction endodeoxyribonuclease RuvC [Crocosphaera sp.]|jgi:crossover junction endodeoxyribonuclease RuvC